MPKHESTLVEKVKERGGIQAVIEDESYLRTLFADEAGKQGSQVVIGLVSTHRDGGPTRNDGQKGKGVGGAAKPVSNYDFQHFKDEIVEEFTLAVDKNYSTFQGKYMIEQARLRNFISEENNRLLTAVTSGPHELVKDEVRPSSESYSYMDHSVNPLC